MTFKAVLAVPVPYAGIPHDEKAYEEKGIDVVKVIYKTEEEVLAAASDADAVITGALSSNVIEKLGKCKLIHSIGIGYDAIDVKAATELGICVSSPADYCLEEVSDHAMALILACARKITRQDNAVRAGKWDSVGKPEFRAKIWPPMFRLKGQTLGLVGFGSIPRTIVPKAKGFGLRVIAFDPYVPHEMGEKYGVELVELGYLLQNSDYISMHSALTPQTHHMLGLEEFKKMKPTAYLINTARGALVDEKALGDALSQGYIAGAGLDVLETESVSPDYPLLKFENVIVTAHGAHYSESSALEIRQRPFEEISRIIDGKWPRCLLNPQVKEKFASKWGKMQEDATSS